jgi:hypothetical protein
MVWFKRKGRKSDHRDERLIFEARRLGDRLVKTADRLEVFADQLRAETERIQKAKGAGNGAHGAAP